MTEHERLAYRHLVGTAKAAHGRTDADAQEEAKGSTIHLRKLLSDDPNVLRLARDGIFVVLTLLNPGAQLSANCSQLIHQRFCRWPFLVHQFLDRFNLRRV